MSIMKLKLPLFLLLGIALLTFACNSGSNGVSSVDTQFDTTGYTTTDLGAGITHLIKKDGGGNPIEEGYLQYGVKSGVWTTYHPDGIQIKSLTSYLDGRLTGPSIVLDTRSQMESLKTYGNNQLNGLSATFKYGKVVTELPYNKGQIDGVFKEYLNGKLQRKIDYVNGKKNGLLTYYDENGNKTVEYQYKNDEKVGGGMIE